MGDKPTRLRINQEPSTLDLLLVNDINNIPGMKYLDPLGASDQVVLKVEYKCYFTYDTNRKLFCL